MKNLICLLVLFICICQIDTLQAQTLMIDNFDKEPTNVGKKHPRYVGAQRGYDIYYQSAKIQLSLVKMNNHGSCNKALRIEFDLPPAFSWGNWVSVRREFQSPMNLQGYKGLELKVRVDAPSPEAFLRITLSDLTDNDKDGDEMWWFDCDKNLLKTKTAKWTQVSLPFNRFFPSFGEGTRHNDGRMNLKKIIAYEINLVSNPGKHPDGIIFLDSLRAYK